MIKLAKNDNEFYYFNNKYSQNSAHLESYEAVYKPVYTSNFYNVNDTLPYIIYSQKKYNEYAVYNDKYSIFNIKSDLGISLLEVYDEVNKKYSVFTDFTSTQQIDVITKVSLFVDSTNSIQIFPSVTTYIDSTSDILSLKVYKDFNLYYSFDFTGYESDMYFGVYLIDSDKAALLTPKNITFYTFPDFNYIGKITLQSDLEYFSSMSNVVNNRLLIFAESKYLIHDLSNIDATYDYTTDFIEDLGVYITFDYGFKSIYNPNSFIDILIYNEYSLLYHSNNQYEYFGENINFITEKVLIDIQPFSQKVNILKLDTTGILSKEYNILIDSSLKQYLIKNLKLKEFDIYYHSKIYANIFTILKSEDLYLNIIDSTSFDIGFLVHEEYIPNIVIKLKVFKKDGSVFIKSIKTKDTPIRIIVDGEIDTKKDIIVMY